MSVPTVTNPISHLDIVIPQGADFKMALLFHSIDANGVSTVIDTGTWNMRFQIRKEPRNTSPLLVFGSVSNGYITRGIEGPVGQQTNVRIKIPAAITKALSDWGKGGYDLMVNYSNGERDILLSGSACLKPATVDW